MAEKLTLQDYYKYNKSDVMHKGDRCRVITINVICASNCTESMYLNPIGKSYYIPLAIVSDCKLILRHISQLTDEENIELKKLYEEAIAIAEKDETMSWESSKTIVDYFRKIGVDIDGMFASGKAVKDE